MYSPLSDPNNTAVAHHPTSNGPAMQWHPAFAKGAPHDLIWGDVLFQTAGAGGLIPVVMGIIGISFDLLDGQFQFVLLFQLLLLLFLFPFVMACTGIVSFPIAWLTYRGARYTNVEANKVWLGAFVGGVSCFVCLLILYYLSPSLADMPRFLLDSPRELMLVVATITTATLLGQYFGGRGVRAACLQNCRITPTYDPPNWTRFTIRHMALATLAVAAVLAVAKLFGILTENLIWLLTFWSIAQLLTMHLMLRLMKWQFAETDEIILAPFHVKQSPESACFT
jgi:hypothetical protein